MHTDDSPVTEIRPLILPDGRMLVSAIDTVYMLGRDHAILWKYSTNGVALTAQPAFNPALNEIALVAWDLTFVRLDARTGKFKWDASINEGATVGQVEAYRNGYLVVVDMSMYRVKERLGKVPFRSLDRLDYWDGSVEDSGNTGGWAVDFPIGARLVVSGDELFAARFSKTGVRLKAIQIPRK